MTWVYLILAGIFEVVWASTMKLSEGFTNWVYSAATVLGMVLSFAFLTAAIKHMPLGLAYPVWTGIGAVGSIIVSATLFKNTFPPLTWVFVFLLVVSIIGIKVTSGH